MLFSYLSPNSQDSFSHAKQIIAGNKKTGSQKDSNNIIADYHHKQHSDCDPEQDKPKHTSHAISPGIL